MPDDEVALMGLLRAKNQEEQEGTFDEGKVRAAVRRGLGRDYAVIGVIRGPRSLEASIGLYLGSAWYNDNDFLADYWNYVLPLHRRSEHAQTLLEFAKWAAVELGKPLRVALDINETTVRKVGLYERKFGGTRRRVWEFDPRNPEIGPRNVDAALPIIGGSKHKAKKLVRAGVSL